MPAPSSCVWKIEPHTATKHQILDYYLKAWFPILAKYPGKVVYVDGFAGPGIYENGEIGSPLIALDCVLNHSLRGRMLTPERKYGFIFVEEDKRRADCLSAVLDSRYLEHPANVEWIVLNDQFERTMMVLLDEADKAGVGVAPAFVFIDPFGFSGLPMDLMKRILSKPKMEVFVTLMAGFINRFVSIDDTRSQEFDRLFGTPDWRIINEIEGNDNRIRFIVNLYQSQLLAGGAQFVRSFEMKSKFNQPLYHLVFASKHELGLRVMKEAMYRGDRTGQYVFSDTSDPKQTLLMDYTEEGSWVPKAADWVHRQFSGQTVRKEEIEEYVWIGTPFIYRAAIMNNLKERGSIQGGKPKTYPQGCLITFSVWQS